MQRWKQALAAIAAAAAATPVFTQGLVREAPRDVKPAILAVSATPPIVTVDGKPDRLSPGSRIRDTNNMLVLSQALAGKTVHTVYRRDPAGLVHEVWLLTPEEYAKLGGAAPGGDPQGHKRFEELLRLIFGARLPGSAR